jgi:hypothetical protein
MFDKKKQDITNVNRSFDYPTIKKMVLLSFKNISKQVKEYHHNDWSYCLLVIDSDCLPSSPSSLSSLLLLKLRIRNTTEYLKWRICILKRDNFQCRICHISLKDRRNLRLEVRHLKRFRDIIIQNNIIG